MSDIQKFDPSTLMQGVKDRIKATFVSLVPDEQWQTMVQKEVDDFFKPKELGYTTRTKASDFEVLCREIIHSETKNKVSEYLKSGKYQTYWSENGPKFCDEAIEKVLVENSGEILKNMILGSAAQMVEGIRNSISNSIANNRY